jgi:hypothetical protein
VIKQNSKRLENSNDDNEVLQIIKLNAEKEKEKSEIRKNISEDLA